LSRKTDRKAVAKLEALYAQLPTVACKGLCSIACGPVPMSTLEAKRMRKADPWRRIPMIHENLRCVYLTDQNRCSVYDVRPLICRVWGVVKRMSCMHGCIPTRWLSDHEFTAIAKTIERLGGPILVSDVDALLDRGDTFLDLPTGRVSEAEAEALAEKTRNLRALHGGRIAGVNPSGEGWVDIDALRKR
jgi:Fe-S-cluster containining protein